MINKRQKQHMLENLTKAEELFNDENFCKGIVCKDCILYKETGIDECRKLRDEIKYVINKFSVGNEKKDLKEERMFYWIKDY